MTNTKKSTATVISKKTNAANELTKQTIANMQGRKVDASGSTFEIATAAKLVKTIVLEAPQQKTQISKSTGMQILEKLNVIQADADKQKAIVVRGRKGKEALITQIYAEYFAAQQSGDMVALVAKVEELLKAKDIKFRKNSRDSTKFVRYVFANYGEDDLSDKEAFKYGRGVDVAYSKKIIPQQYDGFVTESGGYSNIKEEAEKDAASTNSVGSTNGASMLSNLNKLPTVETLSVDDWVSNDENYRVYIAVRGDDDDGLLKAVHLSQEGIEKLMAQIDRERKAMTKPTVEDKKIEDAVYKSIQEKKKKKASILLIETKQALEAARLNKSPMNIARLCAEVRAIEADIRSANAALKKFKEEKDTAQI